MTFFRRGRYLFWIAKELFDKYTRSLLGGLAVGVVTMVIVWLFLPSIIAIWLSPVTRIGVVGEFTPSSLPVFIQQKLSTGLTVLLPDGNAGAGLASSWEATDSGKTYIFHLRSDLNWSDGKRVTAHDVNYSIRDVTLTMPDDQTIIVALKEPYSPFPTLVSKPILKRGLIGFGEYRVGSITLNGDVVQFIRLIAPKSPDKPVLEYRFYRTETQAITAFKLGDIDEINDISSAGELASWKGASVDMVTRHDQIVALFFNLKDPLLGERAVRQALGYALPETTFERAYSPISALSWAYSDKIRKYTPDLTEAKKILNNADIDVKDKEIILTTFPQYIDTAQSIANNWNSLGLSVKVKSENTLPDSFQILLSVQNLPPDPDQYPFWHSTQQNTNITKYGNVKIDKLLEDGRKEIDMDKRKKLYADFQRFLTEDAPAIFYFYPNRYTVRRK